jgi:zinc protease
MVVKAPARDSYVILGFKTPGIADAEQDWEPYALEMLAFILDGGSSSRLSRNLIRGSQIASAAGASYSLFSRLPGMLLLDANPASGHDIAKLETALLKEVEKLKTDLVDEDELSRIRAQLVASKVFERDSIFYQAMQIGRLEAAGLDWRLQDEYVKRLQAVTPEQVRAVARNYLKEDRMTVAVLDPLPLDGGEPVATGGRHVH